MDLADQEKVEEVRKHWLEILNPLEIFPVSALHGFYTDVLLNGILGKLPEGPPFFEKDDSMSDRDMRFFAAEIIREKILSYYQKEIPYSVEVKITGYKESPEIDVISATIFVTRESQKGILLGKDGAAIKKLGTEARRKLETVLQKKVYLELTVKVIDNWRDDEQALRNFGYGE